MNRLLCLVFVVSISDPDVAMISAMSRLRSFFSRTVKSPLFASWTAQPSCYRCGREVVSTSGVDLNLFMSGKCGGLIESSAGRCEVVENDRLRPLPGRKSFRKL